GMAERDFVLLADNVHAGFPECSQLFLRRPFPQANVSVDACITIAGGVHRLLQPDGNGEKIWVAPGTVGPFCASECMRCFRLVPGDEIRGSNEKNGDQKKQWPILHATVLAVPVPNRNAKKRHRAKSPSGFPMRIRPTTTAPSSITRLAAS